MYIYIYIFNVTQPSYFHDDVLDWVSHLGSMVACQTFSVLQSSLSRLLWPLGVRCALNFHSSGNFNHQLVKEKFGNIECRNSCGALRRQRLDSSEFGQVWCFQDR